MKICEKCNKSLYGSGMIFFVILFLLNLFFNTSFASSSKDEQYHYKDKVLVLMYHDVKETEKNEFTLSTKHFEDQIKTLKENGYNVITIESFLNFLHKNGKIPNNAVVITFDDGYKTFYDLAVPIMKKYNVTATNFLIGKFIGTHPAFMTWDQVKELKKQGFSFYSHTYDQHRTVLKEKAEDNNKYKALLSSEYLKDKSRLETFSEYKARLYNDFKLMDSTLKKQLNNTEQILCFPFGAYSNTVLAIGKELKINTFITVKPGINIRGQSLINRINSGAPNIDGTKLMELLKPYNE